MTIAEARARVEPLLLTTGAHADYAHCVQYAQKCRDFATGNTAHRLQQATNEDDVEMVIRRRLSISMSPAIWEELRKPFYQVSRLKGSQITRTFTYEADLSDAERLRRTSILVPVLDGYYDGKPLEDYLSERIVRSVALTDPNAWLCTEFLPFDFRTARAQPYPVLYPCEAVIDFTRQAGSVTSMTARTPVTVKAAKGFRYTTYLDNEALDYWPVLTVEGQAVYTLPEGSTVAFDVVDPSTQAIRWQARLLQHRAGRVPAKPVGYVPDEETDGRTFASPLHAALCFLEAELKTGSELQIVMANVAHPHKLQYVNRCEGVPNNNDGQPWGCTNGLNSALQPCRKCGGTTKDSIQRSALETQTFPLPKDMADVKFKLNEMIAFVAPPVEVPELQMKYQDRLTDRAKQVVFGTELLSKTSTTQTATERMAQLDQLNTALTPMADQISSLYVHGALVSAGYLDVAESLSVAYDFPPDLQLVSVQELEEAYAAAQKAGLDAMYLEQKYKELQRRKLADNPDELRKMEVKMRFVPYIGASDAYVLQLAALGYITPEKRTLRIEQDSIFYELQRDNPNFYDLPTKQQQVLVDAKVKALVAELSSTTGSSGTFRQLTLTPNQPQQAVA